ncbi:MAG: hypothetical protein MOGMAGMI_01890 [Candidatus Omnitrophica bacterium]|nr:hypothetical protein [Candidatus Omnitrophota bacterium]
MSAYQFQLLPALATNEYESLKADIAANGVMVPVEFDQNGQILDGHHRVRAWTELVESGLELPEYPSLVRRFDDQDSRIEHALKLNLQRRHLTREQLRDVAGDLWERGWSKSRIGSTLSVDEGTIRYWLRGSEISEPETVVGRDGKSYPSSRPKQTAVATNAKERTQAQRLLSVDESGDDDSQVSTVIDLQRRRKDQRREQARQANEAIVSESVGLREFVAGEVFQTIVVDPPWDWGDEGDHDQQGQARPTYQTMPFDDVAALPIDDVSSGNAHLYLWITNRSLPKGFSLLERWGYRYVTMLTWCKPSIGLGNYFRGSTEQVLFGVRGSLPLLKNNVGTWFAADRGVRHSQKPDAFYELVESCSPGPWLDVFARSERPGWVTWGAEV